MILSDLRADSSHYLEDVLMLYMPREEGQGLVEYALILVLVAVVVIVILALLGPAIGNIFSNIVNTL
jgi:pilus assembly protein Flp/PilA